MNTSEIRAKTLCKLLVSIIVFTFLSEAVQAVCLKGAVVSGGEDHTMVLMEDGTVWTCGDNSHKQLGVSEDGEPPYSRVLMQVLDGEMNTTSSYIEDINDISAGWQHSMALDSSGFVWTWGWNRYIRIDTVEIVSLRAK